MVVGVEEIGMEYRLAVVEPALEKSVVASESDVEALENDAVELVVIVACVEGVIVVAAVAAASFVGGQVSFAGVESVVTSVALVACFAGKD